MTPIERLQTELPNLTKAERRAADHIIAQPSCLLGATLQTLSQASGSSNSAIIRLAQKLGYEGFTDFKLSIARHLMTHDAGSADANGDPIEHMLATYATYIRRIPEYVDDKVLAELGAAIVGAPRLVVWGADRTAESAMQLSIKLMRLGVFSKLTTNTFGMEDDANTLGRDGVCVLFSMNGRGNARYARLADKIVRSGGRVFLVTMNPKLALRDHVTDSIVLPWVSRLDSENFLEDQIISLAFIEILLYKVAQLLG